MDVNSIYLSETSYISQIMLVLPFGVVLKRSRMPERDDIINACGDLNCLRNKSKNV